MFGYADLQLVLRHQDALRRAAANARLADRISRRGRTEGQPRRLLGLRLSLA